MTDECANEAFNAQDGLAFTWSRFWPYLARSVKPLIVLETPN